MRGFEKEYWDFREQKTAYSFDATHDANSRFIMKLKKHMIGWKEGPNVLDIGCGYGFLLRLMEDEGWNVMGVDISQKALSEASRNTSAPLEIADVEERLDFDDDSFELVTMFDLIEHLASPFKAILNSRRVLRPGGLLAVHCPNANAVGRLINRGQWFGLKDPTHKYLFTPFGLRILVERAGYTIKEVSTPFMPFRKASSILDRVGIGGAIILVAEKTPEIELCENDVFS